MRILFVPKDFPTPENPNSGIFILRRIQAMQALGHDVSVLRMTPWAPPGGPPHWRAYRAIPRDTDVEGIPVRTVRALVPPRMIGAEYVPLQLSGALRREIARTRAQIVHASYILPCGLLAVRQRMVPSVVTMHGIDAHTWPKRRAGLRRATREVLTRASQMTAVSRFLAEVVQEVEPCDVRVIWNGAEERFFFPAPPAPAREALGVDSGRLVIAYAGSLDREKGVFDLIEAASRIVKFNPLLLIAGTGTQAEAMQEQARRLGVDLRLLGARDQAGVAQMFAAADIVALASYIEGLPNVICEAMLGARAIVSTAVGGVPEIVEDGVSGLLVPIGEPAKFAQALERAAADPSLREKLASNARAFAQQHLTWRTSARKYEAMYDDVLARCAAMDARPARVHPVSLPR